jgi:hypothetical protein
MSEGEHKQITLEQAYAAQADVWRDIEEEIENLRIALPDIAPERFKALVRHCKSLVRLFDEYARLDADIADLLED